MQAEIKVDNKSTSEFSWRFRLGDLLGLPLYIHLSFFLWFFGLFWVQPDRLILYISLLLLSIGIHELAHALTCRWLGLGSGTLTIWLFGGFFVPFSELTLSEMSRGQRIKYAIMIFAGPLSNLLLSALFLFLAHATSMGDFQVASKFNLTLAVFNLLPVGRLDGGNILIYLGSTVLNWRKIVYLAGVLSFVLAGGVFIGLFLNSWFGDYSNWAGFLIVMGIQTIKMSKKSDEELKLESANFVHRERALLEQTGNQSLFNTIVSLILKIGLLMLLITSCWYLFSFYANYGHTPTRIAYVARNKDKGVLDLRLVKGMGYPVRAVELDPDRYPLYLLRYLSPSKDGSRIVFHCSPSLDSDLVRVCILDMETEIVTELLLNDKFRRADLSLSPDGERLALSTYDEGVWLIEISKNQMQKISDEGEIATWSPDGKSILVIVKVNGNADVLMVDLVHFETKYLTMSLRDDYAPTYAHDGATIYFVSNRNGASGLYRMNADGTDVIHIEMNDTIYAEDSSVQVSPNNSQIVFECGAAGDIICVANADGSEEKEIAYGEMPLWSPDGSFIVYQATYRDRGIYYILPSGERPYLLTLDTWGVPFLVLP